MNVSEKIKYHRKKAKLTQLELAELIGISKNGLWNYENNKREISVDLLYKIAETLGVSVSEFIEESPVYKIEKEISGIKSLIYDDIEKLKEIDDILDSLREDYLENTDDDSIKEKIDKLVSEEIYIQDRIYENENRLGELTQILEDFLNNTHMKTENGEVLIEEADKKKAKELLSGVKLYDDEYRINHLISIFNKLNSSGKDEALKRIREMTQLKTYTHDRTITMDYDSIYKPQP